MRPPSLTPRVIIRFDPRIDKDGEATWSVGWTAGNRTVFDEYATLDEAMAAGQRLAVEPLWHDQNYATARARHANELPSTKTIEAMIDIADEMLARALADREAR